MPKEYEITGHTKNGYYIEKAKTPLGAQRKANSMSRKKGVLNVHVQVWNSEKKTLCALNPDMKESYGGQDWVPIVRATTPKKRK